jgi:hypothetical protein
MRTASKRPPPVAKEHNETGLPAQVIVMTDDVQLHLQAKISRIGEHTVSRHDELTPNKRAPAQA